METEFRSSQARYPFSRIRTGRFGRFAFFVFICFHFILASQRGFRGKEGPSDVMALCGRCVSWARNLGRSLLFSSSSSFCVPASAFCREYTTMNWFGFSPHMQVLRNSAPLLMLGYVTRVWTYAINNSSGLGEHQIHVSSLLREEALIVFFFTYWMCSTGSFPHRRTSVSASEELLYIK